MEDQLWHYRARLIRAIDGDTIVVDVDTGFGGGLIAGTLRLLGINCPEKNRAATKAAGVAALHFTTAWLVAAQDGRKWPLQVVTSQPQDAADKYGPRWDARVLRFVDGRCLNDDLLAAGHAVRFPT